MTSFWGAVENGEWDARPAADCAIARADGVRNSDGGWTFDLTDVARLWATGALDQNGVGFAVDPDAGIADVQVSFLDTSTDEIDFFITTSRAPEPTPTPAPTPAPPPPPPAPAPPVITPVQTPAPAPTPEPTAAPQPTPGQRELPAQNVLGNQPVVVWFGIPFLIAFGLVTSYVLGPAGRPDPAGDRRGPIGRVLDTRSREQGR